MSKTPREIAAEYFDSKSDLSQDIKGRRAALDGLEAQMETAHGGKPSDKKKGPNIEFDKAMGHLALRKCTIAGIPSFAVYFCSGGGLEALVCSGDDDIKVLVDEVKHWKKATP